MARARGAVPTCPARGRLLPQHPPRSPRLQPRPRHPHPSGRYRYWIVATLPTAWRHRTRLASSYWSRPGARLRPHASWPLSALPPRPPLTLLPPSKPVYANQSGPDQTSSPPTGNVPIAQLLAIMSLISMCSVEGVSRIGCSVKICTRGPLMRDTGGEGGPPRRSVCGGDPTGPWSFPMHGSEPRPHGIRRGRRHRTASAAREDVSPIADQQYDRRSRGPRKSQGR